MCSIPIDAVTGAKAWLCTVAKCVSNTSVLLRLAAYQISPTKVVDHNDHKWLDKSHILSVNKTPKSCMRERSPNTSSVIFLAQVDAKSR